VSKVKVCVDFEYEVSASGQIIVHATRLATEAGDIGGVTVNLAATTGEAFFATKLCDEHFLREAVVVDVAKDARLRERLLQQWQSK
jgi:hypothetical protein